MNNEEILKARREKKGFINAIALLIIIGVINALNLAVLKITWVMPVLFIFWVPAVIYLAFTVWRFCRSVNIGTTMAIVNIILAVLVSQMGGLFLLFQYGVLMHIYSKRTGILLSFWGGDR